MKQSLREGFIVIFNNYDRIVFAGDSVTDMGSQNPVGEGLFDNVGRVPAILCGIEYIPTR